MVCALVPHHCCGQRRPWSNRLRQQSLIEIRATQKLLMSKWRRSLVMLLVTRVGLQRSLGKHSRCRWVVVLTRLLA